MQRKAFTKEDYENSKQRLYGRVSDYTYMKGYGFIYTELGSDIFFSSYDMDKKLQSKLKLGTTVSFIPEERDGKFVATSIEIKKDMAGGKFQFTDSFALSYNSIVKFCLVPGSKSIKEMDISEQELVDHGYSIEDLGYLAIRTKDDEYRFTRKGSPIKADGQIDDIEAVYVQLKELFLKLY